MVAIGKDKLDREEETNIEVLESIGERVHRWIESITQRKKNGLDYILRHGGLM